MQGVSVQQLAEKMKFKCFTPCVDMSKRMITTPEINRPALELAGYFEHFAEERIQIIGMVEYSYLETLSEGDREERYRKLLGFNVPCVIMCRDYEPDEVVLRIAGERGVPILGSPEATSNVAAEAIYFLTGKLAPCISIHGVLVDIYGEGVLIMGESGIGKSEAALELIRRGHRLVTDDVVEIRKINNNTLIGTSPDITRYFIELRGIGIIDVKTLFGVECVKEQQTIDLVIKLEDWKKDKEYDRLGLEEEYTEILGNNIVCHSIPIRPGRNLAVICEAAAANHRQKKMGYNAAKELYRRVENNLKNGNSTEI